LSGIRADWRKRLAFERVMEVLGEAVKRLPRFCSARCPGDQILQAYDPARRRNEFVAAIADRVCFIHVIHTGEPP